MLYYRPIWKEISKEKYNKLTKGLSEVELLFQNSLSREPVFELPDTGVGLINLDKIEIKDFRYYQRTGKLELTFIGSAEGCKAVEEAFNGLIN
ncbi:MAG: hypothetical protein PF569_00180 [Candidatus Woesearchaeota archaeon]|jgi:hypothetical protein|nr:hypothetical protein [Candidatus Woesearchaeota archaeon]